MIRRLMRKAGRRSIRKQLTIGIVSVHMVLMIVFVYDLTGRQQTFLMDRANSRTVRQAAVLAAAAVPQFITHDKAGLQEIVDAIECDATIRSVTIADMYGRIWGDTDRSKINKYLKDDISLSVLAGSAHPQIVYTGPNLVWAAAPIPAPDGTQGWVLVAGDLTQDRAQLTALRRAGINYAGIAVLCGIAFAILLANGITRQLRLLLAGARRMSRECLDEPVPVVTDNDVGELARAFNHTMKCLREERVHLLDARTRLEHEVAERTRAEQRLKTANKAITAANERLREFSYAASHDLQEPLRAVSSYAQLLKRRYMGALDSDADDFIGFIYDGAERMQKLVRGLLDYSRAGNTGGAAAVHVDCNEAIASALRNLSMAVEESGAVIRVGELPCIVAHEVPVAQLFQNLVGNAIKYSRPGTPEITISAEQTAGEWAITVQDRGIGIPKEAQSRIFGIFKRAHAGAYLGTGVGLAICTKIVEHYGGRIWVESEPGKGSSFRFTVPSAHEAHSSIEPKVLSAAAG